MAAQPKWDLGIDDLSSPDTLKAALAELIATMLFVFLSVGSVVVAAGGGGVVAVALTFGFTIALLAAGIGPISGGHINPAISFAMVITGRISVARGVIYIVAQVGGAAIGMAMLFAFLNDAVVFDIPGMGGNEINENVMTRLGAVGVEATGTFVLVWTVFATAVTKRGNSGTLAPLFIGLAVAVVHFVLIPLTGTGINPARTTGPAIVMNRFDDLWVFWVGPLIGATVAALSYYLLYLTPEDEAA